MDSKLTKVTESHESLDGRIEAVEKKQATADKDVQSLQEEVSNYQVKVDILSDLVVRQNQEIAALKEQMTDTQIRGMRNNITISGIPETQGENCIQAVNDFIVNQLRITDKLISIEHAYRLGSGKARPMLVMLRHFSDKARIFENVGNLKGVKQNGMQCFVSAQLPEVANEKRRFINSKMSANKNKHGKNKLPLTVKQGQLLFKNQPLKTKVHPPSPRDMVRLRGDELDQINAIPLHKGVHEESQDNFFVGYATSVTNHSKINDAYKKMKLLHGEATHIACAFKLRSVAAPYDEGGCDDDEHGASRILLQLIQEGRHTNVAVFMVRYYSGIKLGPLRFDLMKKVVASAIVGWQVSFQGNPEDDPWSQQVQQNEEEIQGQREDQTDNSSQAFRH